MSFSDARDLARGLSQNCVFTEFSRSIDLWDTSACVRIGHYDRKVEEWQLDHTIAMTAVVRLPSDVSGDHGATPRAHDQEGRREPGPHRERGHVGRREGERGRGAGTTRRGGEGCIPPGCGRRRGDQHVPKEAKMLAISSRQ